jgi:hypothetical protein
VEPIPAKEIKNGLLYLILFPPLEQRARREMEAARERGGVIMKE